MAAAKDTAIAANDAESCRKGRPRNFASAQRRSDIMSAALERFANHGYANTSLNVLARDVGITQPAVYHYFRDKQTLYEEVFEAALERAWSAVHARLSALPAREKGLLDLAEAMNAGGLDIDERDERQTNLFLTTVPVEATRHPELHHLLERRFELQDRMIRAIVLPTFLDGRMPAFADADTAVRAIRLLMMGWAYETFTQRERTQENAEALRSILHYLEAPPRSAESPAEESA